MIQVFWLQQLALHPWKLQESGLFTRNHQQWQYKMLVRMWNHRDSCSVLVGMQPCAATLEALWQFLTKLNIFLSYGAAIALFFYLPKWVKFKWSEVTQSCPTCSDPMDCSPPGSSIHGIFQARVLEWGAIAFSVSKLLPLCNTWRHHAESWPNVVKIFNSNI